MSLLSNDPALVSFTGTDVNSEEVMQRNINDLRLCGYRPGPGLGGVRLDKLARAARSRKLVGSPYLTFEPFYFFFYGSLQHPKVVAKVARSGIAGSSDYEPVLKPGSIKGWKAMMWGPFPALVPKEGNEVKGKYWKCESIEEVYNLIYYETDAYRMEFCDITTEEGEVIKNGRVFVSTDEDESELQPGSFDLEEFSKRWE